VKEIEGKIKKDKEAMIALKEKEIASQQASLQAKAKELQAREDQVREQELSMRDKRNQLFKSYDALTERIYAFERECDKFKM
jgi:uncharacterized protein (DUF3084 family)